MNQKLKELGTNIGDGLCTFGEWYNNKGGWWKLTAGVMLASAYLISNRNYDDISKLQKRVKELEQSDD